MNKLLKGSIAGAAGVALLLGGAGTFALWNSSTTVPGGTIVAGDLQVTGGGVGVWADETGTIDISTFRAVPGDVLTYSKTINVVGTGDNLIADLALAPSAITASTGSAADVALAAYLVDSVVLDVEGDGIAPAGVNEYTITDGADGTATVTVTVDFPKDDEVGFENSTKLGSVNLADLEVTLTQQ